MSHLLSKARTPDEQGRIQQVTPESANWDHVGFEAFKLTAGQVLEQDTLGCEVCLVLVAGKATVTTGKEHWDSIGKRSSPFDDQAPYAAYVPPGDHFRVAAETELELAVCRAPATGEYPARLITPDACHKEVRGEGTNTRRICNILFGNMAAESLLVVEVFTPGGNWSSYPPHKHDSDNAPEETQLEETYYHRLNPPQGFAFQRVYTDDRSLDETMSVENHDLVMVPEGYHPVGAPHGYDLYYLNVMAGPKREWIFHNDPDHEWMLAK
ncbi:5-deoxy-glucuronate isomerase [Porticoccus sp. GXU_MW_L64]